MPPEVMKRLIRRDVTGKVGNERVRIPRQALEGLPGFYQGPYGKLRKWIVEYRGGDPFVLESGATAS